MRGEEQSDPQQIVINQRVAGAIMNNVTLGKYAAHVDETPLSASFLDGVFNELLRLKELGVPIPDDWVVDVSSLPRKEELKLILQQAREAQAQGMPVPEAEGRGMELGATAGTAVQQTGGPVV